MSKTKYDDRDELVCSEACEYRGTSFSPGDRILGDHPAAARLPECFRKVRDDDKFKWSLRSELQYRSDHIEHLEREDAARTTYFDRRRRLRSEEAFWRDTAELLEGAERGLDLDHLPDPALEVEEEERVAAIRRDRLGDPASDEFWDATTPLLERHAGYNVLPAEIRELEED